MAHMADLEEGVRTEDGNEEELEVMARGSLSWYLMF